MAAQKHYVLGTRVAFPHAAKSRIHVYPDLMIEAPANDPRYIIDAKYKTNAQKAEVRINEADIYEAMAFAKASNCEHVVLAYPALGAETKRPVGTASLFERLSIEQLSIYGIQVETRGISKKRGIQEFSTRLKSDIEKILKTNYT